MTSQQTPAAGAPINKRISVLSRSGERLSLDISLADEHGKQSAAEYLEHVYERIKHKLDEPMPFAGFKAPDPHNQERMREVVLFIAAFHDSFFGTFNRQSTLPDQERTEFLEIFLLAAATVLDGRDLQIDLSTGRGRIRNELSLD
ncbi:hypothetical protein [Acidihalobacter ferrooxydans]|uniref:Uncharacterized protein n=1 Tax=Acidihalobacter ferrooxydans TaxID=1765967 RepID=A0A1P8UJD2_9GAMM|nr:hypothetical protein [Acidihalobacter ferrooxydans]APZ43943.1 hypothetical protein BW247_13280 [Acidihalobacter ferrooxydans]